MNSFFYDVSQLLMMPILWTIYAGFVFSLFELGRFGMMATVRHQNRSEFERWDGESGEIAGYPIASFYRRNPSASLNEVEVHALEKLELIRIVTRITPMLGLIATLIPMGPALMALAENDVNNLSELLRTAFTAVVLALFAASITFWSASVRKRWYAEEITAAEKSITSAAVAA